MKKILGEEEITIDVLINNAGLVNIYGSKTSDGFEIAEVDLKLRGPGDLMGTQQSGVLNLRIADIVKDQDILSIARNAAIAILKSDPSLSLSENLPVKMTYIQLAKYKNIWNFIS